MTAMGHQETRRPCKPRDRFTSVTGPRCGGSTDLPSNEIREILPVFALAVSSRAARPLFVLNPRLLNDLVAAALWPAYWSPYGFAFVSLEHSIFVSS